MTRQAMIFVLCILVVAPLAVAQQETSDGGHVIFTLLGKQAQRLYMPVLFGFLVLSFFNSAWLVWTILLFLLGRTYAVPLDTITDLDQRRRWLGYAALIIFVLVFVPNPLRLVEP